MAYFVALASAFLVLSAATALRPGRRGLFATLAYPVGWAAGELAGQAFFLQAGLLGLLWWWGWPSTAWLGSLVIFLAVVVMVENAALIFIQFLSRRVVRRAMEESPDRPLTIAHPRDDLFGRWWRTALQVPFHPRDMQLHRNLVYGPLPRHRLDIWRLSTTRTDAPVIYYVHGGAWTFGDKREQGRPICTSLCAEGGSSSRATTGSPRAFPGPRRLKTRRECSGGSRRTFRPTAVTRDASSSRGRRPAVTSPHSSP
jgi:hypothetical protein